MRISVQRVGLNVAFVLQQPIKDIDRLPNAARNEVREQRDVSVGDVIVPLSEGLRYVKEVVSF